jgi:methionine-gamma-lyase
MTKFINGHSDVVAGILVAKDPAVLARLAKVHLNTGGTMDPHQAWLVCGGSRRSASGWRRRRRPRERSRSSCWAHPAVSWVRYPWLASHPGHELARRQMRGGGAIISFGVRGGWRPAAR